MGGIIARAMLVICVAWVACCPSVRAGEEEPRSVACPPAALFSQPVITKTDPVAVFNLSTSPVDHFERATGISGPFDLVRWYGIGAAQGTMDPCAPSAGEYTVAIHQDMSGQPGALVRETTLEVVRDTTGVTHMSGGKSYLQYGFVAFLGSPLDLSDCWVRIEGAPEGGCDAYWLISETGLDGGHFEFDGDDYANAFGDLSLCLSREGPPDPREIHSADWNGAPDNFIDISELLRLIQFFNFGAFCCEDPLSPTEDGYQPGACALQSCLTHAADYAPQDWMINISELLRLIQFFNLGGYVYCPDVVPETEDGYCPGMPM